MRQRRGPLFLEPSLQTRLTLFALTGDFANIKIYYDKCIPSTCRRCDAMATSLRDTTNPSAPEAVRDRDMGQLF
jgi:hypothetical protein